jgi:hypothetical protein
MVYMVDVIKRKNVLSLRIMILSVRTDHYSAKKFRQSLIWPCYKCKFHIFNSFGLTLLSIRKLISNFYKVLSRDYKSFSYRLQYSQ